ncbi:protein KINESIN LIGHT CHAIN-RELATED 2-like [Primulina huaijiensis]|uniref:protein KINESIN LIGHT CHAIN-RELATED 2-like n=1 Tax=Primulina huaijiensis TaxID=1492673 RepID=UPI003CC78A1D
MPGYVMDGSNGENISKDLEGYNSHGKEIFAEKSPRSPLSTHSLPLSTMSSYDTDSIDLALDGAIDTSIDQLYRNICEIQSSDHSPSMRSFYSYGDESRIDSELRFFAGVNYAVVEVQKEVVVEKVGGEENSKDEILEEDSGKSNLPPRAKRTNLEACRKSSSMSKTLHGRPPTGKQSGKGLKRLNTVFSKNETSPPFAGKKWPYGNENQREPGYLGPYLLKQTRNLVASGDNNCQKALELALRAMKSFEFASNAKPNLDFVMCLHTVAALYCRLGRYTKAVPVLERSIKIPLVDLGHDHAVAKFAGCMQLGDTYAILDQFDDSILLYTAGLDIQRHVLGEKHPQFGETCRYIAEALVQAMRFDEAEKLCLVALDIHKENKTSGSAQEIADRRLMGLICDSKGDYEGSLEHYILARMAMVGNGQIAEVADIDCNIGDTYLSLERYEEAVFTYQKALNMFKSSKGENHSLVAMVYIRLADLYDKIGKFTECDSYCENALRIYDKPSSGSLPEEIASGLVDISVIYESMHEPNLALQLLQRAIKVYGDGPGQLSVIAGIEAQMGSLYYILGSYFESYRSLKRAISKFRETGEKKSAIFGVVLNQFGLACMQLSLINEACDLFEEARTVLETVCGPCHADILGVYSNLAGIYDAMGRTGDAIQILDYVVEMREEKPGTANSNVEDEKRRLSVLIKESRMVPSRRSKSLEALISRQ